MKAWKINFKMSHEQIEYDKANPLDQELKPVLPLSEDEIVDLFNRLEKRKIEFKVIHHDGSVTIPKPHHVIYD